MGIRSAVKVNKCLCAIMVAAAGILVQAHAATYYVSPTGSNDNEGSKDKPFAGFDKGQSAAQAGDTVYFLGGNYAMNSTTAEVAINLSKSGSSGKRIHYFAYPGEKPVFDFKGMTAQKRIKGMLVTGNWLHVKGLELKNVPQSAALKAHENWCVYVNGGGNNIFELLDMHHNMGPGFFIQDGGNNLVLNSDSHDNYDAFSYTDGTLNAGENADGFGCHVKSASSTGNVFRGCRAWMNADDGWDFISCLAPVTVENCWTWNNGYKAGTNPPEPTGNGNGFKVGGFGANAEGAPNPVPQHMVRFCLSFNNYAAGFYQNHHPISNFYYNNTSFNNRSANYNLLGYKNGDASMGILRNNISFMGGKDLSNNTLGNGVDAVNNTWNLSSLAPTNADFQSIDTAGVYAPRKADGSLPNITFMQLKAGSKLIDKGVDVKLSFGGAAPDMGAFETGVSIGLAEPGKRLGAGRKALQARTEGSELVDLTGKRFGRGIRVGPGAYIFITP